MPDKLTALFCPKSVAVVGASRSPEKIGAVVLQNIINSKFKGKVYAVNPHAQKIGEVECFKNIKELPEVPDLAVVALPKEVVLEVMNEAGEKGIKNLIIFTAGFKEEGSEGAEVEKELSEIAKKYEMNILGPNCLGFVNKRCPINATFADVSEQKGNLRFISQSGAIASSLFDWCRSKSLGFSEFITLGNKADINENDVLEYFLNSAQNNITTLADDGSSKVEPIGMYLESISDGEEFIKLAKKVSHKDPIFILKPGKSEAASSAMQSHTGSIAGADDVLDTALKEAGILRCNTLQEFFDISKAFSWEDIPEGPKVAVISNAGGPAVISADAITYQGLEVSEFDEETKKKLNEVLPRAAAILNPIDVMGDALPKRYSDAIEIVLSKDECDALVVILTPQMVTKVEETAEIIGAVSKKYKKPVFCSFMGGNLVFEGIKKLDEYKIPSFNYPEQAIAAIGAMWRFKNIQQKNKHSVQDISVLNTQILPEEIKEIIKNAQEKGHSTLNNIEADQVIRSAGINTPLTKIARDFEEALQVAEDIEFPVVLKMSSPGLVHKKKVGGVIVNIHDRKELEEAWYTLQRKINHLDDSIQEKVQIQIQKEVVSGVEVIVGIKQDPTFGPVLLFGAGGSLAEMIADKNLHLLPVDKNGAKELVEQSKVYNLLKETESEPAHALDKLYDVIVNLSGLIKSAPEIAELEINPVMVTLNDVWAVDSKVYLEKKRPEVKGPKFKTATVLSTDLVGGKTRFFELEMEEPFDFTPGHYISVKVSDKRINCYSIAGQKDNKHFNLLVDSSPGGPGSKFFEALKPGDKITYVGPFGNMEIKPDDGAEDVLFLATGCGLAPFKYMMETLLEEDPGKKVVLYLGLDKYENIILKEYLDDLAKKHSNFSYKISLEKESENWDGPTGYITELVKKDYSTADNCSAYLCGSKFMIDDVKNVLVDNGCPPARIYAEQF